jgi:N-acetyltransferase
MVERLVTALRGQLVTLEPLAPAHVDGLRAAASDARIWQWMWTTDFDTWLNRTPPDAASVAFATCIDGTPLGSTSYLAVRPEHRVVEIGNTWLSPSAWGGGANIEAKLLMLRHAFEVADFLRVEFKTDALNERARAALAALPAQFEGIHRRHMLVRGGHRRDSAWYSVIDDDWPEVRANLERRLRRYH